MSGTFYSYNKDDQAVVEYYISSNRPLYKMSFPMIEYWHKEVSYILDAEEWSDEQEDYYYYKEWNEEEFFAGKTPKLIADWRKALPKANTKNRRTTWLEIRK